MQEVGSFYELVWSHSCRFDKKSQGKAGSRYQGILGSNKVVIGIEDTFFEIFAWTTDQIEVEIHLFRNLVKVQEYEKAASIQI